MIEYSIAVLERFVILQVTKLDQEHVGSGTILEGHGGEDLMIRSITNIELSDDVIYLPGRNDFGKLPVHATKEFKTNSERDNYVAKMEFALAQL